MSRPNAENLRNEILNTIQELDEDKLVHISMDGPNANWQVLELILERREEKECKQLLQLELGRCGLHTILIARNPL